MMLLAIRLATAADAHLLDGVAHAAYAKYAPRMVKAPAPVFYDYAQVVATGQTWALIGDGEVRGMVTLVPNVDHLLFRNLAVLPAFQGKGLGRAALAFAEREAMRLGTPEIRLWTNVHMPENVPFYRSAGFVETHRDEAGGYSFIYMAKSLRAGVDAPALGVG